MVRRIAIVAVLLAVGWAGLRLASRAAEPGKPQPAAPSKSTQGQSAGEPLASMSSDTSAIDKALDDPITLSFDKLPLKDVTAKIAAEQHINVLLDHKPLADAGIAEDTPITFDVKNCSLRRALHWMLCPLDLDCYSPTDNLLLITAADAAKLHTTLRLYDVRDLLPATPPAAQVSSDKTPEDETALVATITACIAPKSWDAAGGSHTIAPGLGTLAVAQRDSVQGQVAGLLDALRQARRSPGGTVPVAADSPAVARAAAGIRARLARRQDVEFPPSSTVLKLRDWLTDRGIATVIDEKSLKQAAIRLDTPLQLDGLKAVPLGWALERLLDQRGLAYFIDGELLIITTEEAAKSTNELVVYPVADLLAEDSGGNTDEPPYFDGLIDILTSTVAPESWNTSGGIGVISPVRSAKALVIAQTGEVHAKIAKLLAVLRTRPPDRKPAGEPPAPLDNSPVIRIYSLAPPGKGQEEMATESQRADRYVTVVRDLIEPKSWTDGSGYIAAVPAQILVRQTPEVQRRVEKLLQDMGALVGPNANNAAPSAGGRGGFGGGAFDVRDSP